MSVKVYSYEDSNDVANSVAKYVISLQEKVLATSPVFKIAVSGGSLGKVLKKGLIDNEANKSKVQWSKWEVYFSDERLVPLDHEDSNYGLFNTMVLESLKENSIELPKVYTIDESLLKEDESTDAQIAAEYEKILPAKLDLVLLGCGPDGHTCSLFPGHRLLEEKTKRITHLNDSPKPPPRRITFTFDVLENSSDIAFVAEGAGKAPILKQIFSNEKSNLPCELVNELKGPQTVWFVNDPAVEGVPVVTSKF